MFYAFLKLKKKLSVSNNIEYDFLTSIRISSNNSMLSQIDKNANELKKMKMKIYLNVLCNNINNRYFA